MEFSNEKRIGKFCHCTSTIADMEHINFFQKKPGVLSTCLRMMDVNLSTAAFF